MDSALFFLLYPRDVTASVRTGTGGESTATEPGLHPTAAQSGGAVSWTESRQPVIWFLLHPLPWGNSMNRRVVYALGVMLSMVAGAGCGARIAVTNKDVANLARRTAEANAALVRGDIDGYLTLIKQAKDYMLMAPFSGAPTRG